MTFPTPSSSEAKVEEDSDVTSSSEEKTEEKSLLTSYAGDKKLRKNKHSCCEGQFLIPGFVAQNLVNFKCLALLRSLFLNNCVDPSSQAPPGQIFKVSSTRINRIYLQFSRLQSILVAWPLTAESPECLYYACL